MHTLGTIREFNTLNYKVRVLAEAETDVDLSWDDTGHVAEQLDRSELIAFCAHVKVIHTPTGAVLGEDYLGQCIYKDFDDFMDHRECGIQNRKYESQGERGRCGSYFSDMIREAIGLARQNYKAMRLGKLREER